MTPQEFEYIQRAVKALEDPMSLTARIKIERTMAQICGKSATELENNLVDTIEDRLYNKHLNNT
jgi:hypothetical protein